MSGAFIIETDGRAAGVAVRDGNNFQFFASDHSFWGLEARKFRNLREVRRSVADILADDAAKHRSPGASSTE
jgi:thiol-disulfide isomerase/thioredoxin